MAPDRPRHRPDSLHAAMSSRAPYIAARAVGSSVFDRMLKRIMNTVYLLTRSSGRPFDHYRSAPVVRQTAIVAYFVVLRRNGPQWDASLPLEDQSDWSSHASFMDGLVDAGFVVLGGPLADEYRVVLVVEAESEDAVRDTLARDPWSETHLVVDTIDRWTIRLDGRSR